MLNSIICKIEQLKLKKVKSKCFQSCSANCEFSKNKDTRDSKHKLIDRDNLNEMIKLSDRKRKKIMGTEKR